MFFLSVRWEEAYTVGAEEEKQKACERIGRLRFFSRPADEKQNA